ncbi:MAG: tetratricopeptide repeat protein [Bacteroidia bacterium]|nr:tetratricopeptide repeat protein [Bacteroidia bacterium]
MRTPLPTLCLLLMICAASAQTKKQTPTLKLADSLFQSQQWQPAISMYEAVFKKSPGDAQAWFRLGVSYQNAAQSKKAVSCYVQALKQQAAPALRQAVYVRLAKIYSAANQVAESKVSLDSALQLGYAAVNELESHADFANLRQADGYDMYKARAFENAQPCLKIAQTRQFDFWIGEWDAYVTGTTNLAGHSRIDQASGGCMILENWTSAGNIPFSGKSMNFVDPATGKWKQVWVGSSGVNVQEFTDGEYRDGAMRFEFEQDTPSGKSFVHFYFYNEGPDQVRQVHETSADGKTWNTNYDFTYKRRK